MAGDPRVEHLRDRFLDDENKRYVSAASCRDKINVGPRVECLELRVSLHTDQFRGFARKGSIMSYKLPSSRLLGLIAAASLCAVAGGASASSVVFSGAIDNCGSNAALRSSSLATLTAADCPNDAIRINNVALYQFTVATAGSVSIQSDDLGFGLGPDSLNLYLSLFSGTGNSATFLSSSVGQLPGSYPNITTGLAAADYTLVISGWGRLSGADAANESNAEFDPPGGLTLGRGFLGNVGMFGSDSPNFGYHVTVTTPDDSGGGSVPAPATFALALAALLGAAVVSRRRAHH